MLLGKLGPASLKLSRPLSIWLQGHWVSGSCWKEMELFPHWLGPGPLSFTLP